MSFFAIPLSSSNLMKGVLSSVPNGCPRAQQHCPQCHQRAGTARGLERANRAKCTDFYLFNFFNK